MKWVGKVFLSFVVMLTVLSVATFCPQTVNAAKAAKKAKALPGSVAEKIGKPNATFDANQLSDMSDFDPANPVIPKGDTIKIALVMPFSGPASLNGDLSFQTIQWVAHDINKRGGIWVDGKKKRVQIIKADNMSRPDQTKKICERMILKEKVDILSGTSGSNLMKIMMDTAAKYKVICHNWASPTAELMDATHFNRYTFMTHYDTWSVGHSLAYYYGQIRKKEKKFYIICQDYSFGRAMADGFKQGLKDFYPEAKIVGEDYHKLFLTDFAPYLTKIKASSAEVIFTGDWIPDLSNLIKQARSFGIKLPFANRVMDDANMLSELGIENSKGLINLNDYEYTNPTFKTPGQKKFHTAWHTQWKKNTKPPYNNKLMTYMEGQVGKNLMQFYWLLSVIERARSTNPEKIIAVWENDSYKTLSGKIFKMRACDHKTIQDLVVTEFVPPQEQKVSFNMPPYQWFTNCSYSGYLNAIPAAKVLPWMDQNLDRCKGKNGWGE